MSIFPNKEKVSESLVETTKFFLKYIYIKWMYGFQLISVNKDMIFNEKMMPREFLGMICAF